jgi:hypothetical protein
MKTRGSYPYYTFRINVLKTLDIRTLVRYTDLQTNVKGGLFDV